MDVIRKKNGGLTEMDNYMREFILGLRRDGKELRALLPICEGTTSNSLWNKLVK